MSQTVLDVRGVGKCYAAYRSNLHHFAEWFGLPSKRLHEHWAVRDVSFSLKAGDGLAVIGQNGAGKSTLLKLITGTARPNAGHIQVSGRISAMLELGLGLNPEFTGRQNVYLAGGLMGFPVKNLTDLMPAIDDFAELGEFFDQPLRIYSSGMRARLAFSLATAVRPEVLIVDEVLSVGDSYFQHKSFDRILQFKEQGTSLLFVSHSMSDVRALCDRVILLDKGCVIKDGLPDEVVDYYNALIAEKENAKLTVEQRREKSGWLFTRSGTHEARVVSLRLLDAVTREKVVAARVGQRLCLVAEVDVCASIPRMVLGYMLRDKLGHVVWGTNTWHTQQMVCDLKTGDKLTYIMPFTCALGPGSYSFSPALVSTDTHLVNNYEWTDNALVFDVINADHQTFIGTNWLDANFEISVNRQ
jgi:lipopolysaccharide transport system ATP-binding protein